MILVSEEKIKEYTEKGYWGDKTRLDYFKEHVRSFPEVTALVDPYDKEELTNTKPEKVTYAELDRYVDAVATSLLKMGIGKDDIVLVQIPNCWELGMLYLAITRAGALITPLPMQWRKREISYVADHARVKAIITAGNFRGYDYLGMMKEVADESSLVKNVITLDQVREMAEGEIDEEKLDSVQVDANDIFTLCWTSGTEAEPKGCPLSHNNWILLGKMQVEVVDIKPKDVLLTAGPMVNMASTGTAFIPWLIAGGTLVLHHPFNPHTFIQQMVQEKVNYTLLVPAIANMIVKHPQVDQFDLSSVRAITMGAAPPSLFTIKEFKRRWDIEVGNIWGQNEGTGIISGPKDVPELEKRVDHLPQFGKPNVEWSSWIASACMKTKLVSPETGQEVTEAGEVGELAFGGATIIPGYFKRPDLNENSFDEDGYFYTGDLFVVKEDNYIGFYERKKDIIIRGGFNISAQEVENVLLEHPKITDAAIVGMPDEVLGEKVCAYIVPREGETVGLGDLREFMETKGMAKYKIPERVETMEALPRNPVGKLLKNVLREDIRSKL